MLNRRSAEISDLLAEVGPALTTDLARHLMAQGVSYAAARQRISRRSEEVRVLHGLPFPRRSRFIYLESQFGTKEYWDALIQAISVASPSYASALTGLRMRGGFLPTQYFHIASGAPVRQTGQLASSLILDRLLSVDLVSSEAVDGIGECVVLGGRRFLDPTAVSLVRARLLTEALLLDAIRAWLGRMNMASPSVTTIRGDSKAPQFATYLFDLCGPSYLSPLVRNRKGKRDPGFFVADVIVGKDLNTEEVKPFIRKCTTLAQLKRVRPFVPMLIADNFSPEALHECRSRGIIATRPETLFGKDVALALNDLFQALTKAAAIAAASPDRIEKLFGSLSAIEGAAGNLRGALFEVMVGHVVHAIEGGSIDIGVLVTDLQNSCRAEVDVRLVREKVVKIYECKGYQPSNLVSETEVEDWLKKKVPTIYNAHAHEPRFQDCRLKFEFWTCGGYHEKAIEKLKVAQHRTRKYDIDWKDGLQVHRYLAQLKSPGIRKIFNEHYLKHPLRLQ